MLDIDAYDGPYDEWFFHLREYVDAVSDAVIHDSDYQAKMIIPATKDEIVAAKETVKALHDADKRLNPIKIFLEIETAIRMEFFEFKDKWDAETKASDTN